MLYYCVLCAAVCSVLCPEQLASELCEVRGSAMLPTGEAPSSSRPPEKYLGLGRLLLEAPPPPTVDAKTDSSTAGKSVMTINHSNISLHCDENEMLRY